jgi:ribonuclease P protein component
MAVRSVANGLPLSRYAFAISKRVGIAVVRNKVRRRLRELLRSLPITEGFDVVISVRPEAAVATYQDLEKELTLLLKRSRLLADRPGSPD